MNSPSCLPCCYSIESLKYLEEKIIEYSGKHTLVTKRTQDGVLRLG